MYLPSFFTGRLVARFGSVKIMLAGVAMMIVYACLALSGTSWALFAGALILSAPAGISHRRNQPAFDNLQWKRKRGGAGC